MDQFSIFTQILACYKVCCDICDLFTISNCLTVMCYLSYIYMEIKKENKAIETCEDYLLYWYWQSLAKLFSQFSKNLTFDLADLIQPSHSFTLIIKFSIIANCYSTMFLSLITFKTNKTESFVLFHQTNLCQFNKTFKFK